MTYLLDTNACINFLRQPATSSIAQRLKTLAYTDVVLSVIVRSELIYGALRSRDVAASIASVEAFCLGFQSLAITVEVADRAAEIRAKLALTGNPIGPYDTLIAATCLEGGLTLVTHNAREFARISGLAIEDWQAP